MTEYNKTLQMNVESLRTLQDRLLPALNLYDSPTMFYRMQDFTRSHATLNEVFSSEYDIAKAVLPKSRDSHELMKNLPDRFNAWRVGQQLFVSADLAPALRHFVNDACRLLEPLVPIIARKFPDITCQPRQSLDSYLKKLQENEVALPFDVELVIDLYEVWNDYKHRATLGLQATPWTYNNQRLEKARPKLPESDLDLSCLDLTIDEFGDLTTSLVIDIVDFAIPEPRPNKPAFTSKSA